MTSYLVFRLAAALAATGDIATQARRDVERWPARSAVLGVIGAALGLRRDDTNAQADLQAGYDVGVRVRSSGTLLRDYHTVQTVPSAAAKRPDSRVEAMRDARRKGSVNTILTEREYREGMYVEVALRARDRARWTFDEIINALERPQFVLYFGRKACPLTSPVCARRIDALDVFAAFSEYAALDVHRASPECPAPDAVEFVALDPALAEGDPTRAERVRRWDMALDRQRWHFAEREVVIVTAHDGGIMS